MDGDGGVVAGWQNKLQVAISKVPPACMRRWQRRAPRRTRDNPLPSHIGSPAPRQRRTLPQKTLRRVARTEAPCP